MKIPTFQRKDSKCFDQREKSVAFEMKVKTYSKNMLDMYTDRPDKSFLNGRYGCVI